MFVFSSQNNNATYVALATIKQRPRWTCWTIVARSLGDAWLCWRCWCLRCSAWWPRLPKRIRVSSHCIVSFVRLARHIALDQPRTEKATSTTFTPTTILAHTHTNRKKIKHCTHPEYGRTCSDIGCLPSEKCTMVQDSCSYSQRDGKDCGNYPTCVRNPHATGGSSGKWNIIVHTQVVW